MFTWIALGLFRMLGERRAPHAVATGRRESGVLGVRARLLGYGARRG
jgi:hypothetical protein